MRMTAQARLFVLAIVLVAVHGCAKINSDLPNANDFRIKGWSQTQVRASFGEPKLTQTYTKKDNPHIFGEIERVWSKVPEGATVDIWVYEVQGGNIELYFVRPSSLVWDIGFAPEGAVY